MSRVTAHHSTSIALRASDPSSSTRHSHRTERISMRPRLVLALLFAVTALRLEASCGSSSCPIDLHALNRPMAGQFALDLSLQYIDQDQPRIFTRRARVGEIPSEHEELRTVNRAMALGMAYGLTNRLQLSASLPYI